MAKWILYCATIPTSFLYLSYIYPIPDRSVIEWNHPRAFTAEIELTDIYKEQYGIARIVSAPNILKEVEGQLCWFYLPQKLSIPVSGIQLQMTGELCQVESYFPAGHSFREFLLKEKKVHFLLHKVHVHQITGLPHPLFLGLQHVQKSGVNILQRTILDERPWHNATSQLAALTLGDRSNMQQSTKDTFIHSGTLHLFAISGLHIGMVALLVNLLLQRLPLSYISIQLLTLTILQMYVLIVGNPPSAQRTFWMVFAFLLASMLQRKRDFFPSLILAACCVLLISPNQLYSLGFHLSFSIVASIFCYALPLQRSFLHWWSSHQQKPFTPEENTQSKNWRKKSIDFLTASLSISLSAMLVSAPMIVEVFEIFSLVGILLNILFVPLAMLCLSLAISSCLFGAVHLPFVSGILNEISCLLLFSAEQIAAVANELPGAYFRVSFPIQNWGYALSAIIMISILVSTRIHGKIRFLLPWFVFSFGMALGICL